jgi:hypothetical protein
MTLASCSSSCQTDIKNIFFIWRSPEELEPFFIEKPEQKKKRHLTPPHKPTTNYL